MQIKIKLLTCKVLNIDIEPTDTITRLKEVIQEKEGVLPQQQKLTFGRCTLEDNKTIKDYEIKAGDNIFLVLLGSGAGSSEEQN